MAQARQLIRLALFGQPVKASLSPSIHRQFAAQAGFKIDFRCFETNTDVFPQALEAFRVSGGTGCNITVPLKRDAWAVAGQASAGAEQAQAANTLVHQQSKGWLAFNTDGLGLLADLQGNHGIRVRAQRLLIMGAGGAAAGILGPLQAAGPAQIMLVNRNLERARSLASRFGHGGNVAISSWQELPRQGCFDLVINATSLGHKGAAPPLQAAQFAAGASCYDLNYSSASQALKKRCEGLGQHYLDGLGMLVEQAAESFHIWTGKRPDSSAVLQRLRASL